MTFHLVCLGWLLFRAGSLEQALGMLSAIVHRPAIPAARYLVPVLVVVIPLLIIQLIQYLADDLDVIARTPWYVRSVFYTACFYAIVLGGEFRRPTVHLLPVLRPFILNPEFPAEIRNPGHSLPVGLADPPAAAYNECDSGRS